jgi:hypothetical protein
MDANPNSPTNRLISEKRSRNYQRSKNPKTSFDGNGLDAMRIVREIIGREKAYSLLHHNNTITSCEMLSIRS